VFTGRVESSTPDIPSAASLTRRVEELFPGETLDSLINAESPKALAELKILYAEWLPDNLREQISVTSDWKALEGVIEKALEPGRKVAFRIEKAYKGLPETARTFEVWTDFSDCGIQFLKGERYLVYATAEKGKFGATACSRTQRLSDAGEDLVYLHFVEHGGVDIGRLYGFVTSSELDLSSSRSWDFVNSPVPDLPVELRSSNQTLMTTTTSDGRFVFDGLSPGEYEVAVLGKEYPDQIRQLADPRRVRINGPACRQERFYVPKSLLEKK
jgi:hypothetical protein